MEAAHVDRSVARHRHQAEEYQPKQQQRDDDCAPLMSTDDAFAAVVAPYGDDDRGASFRGDRGNATAATAAAAVVLENVATMSDDDGAADGIDSASTTGANNNGATVPSTLRALGVERIFVVSLGGKRLRSAERELLKCGLRGAELWPAVVGRHLFAADGHTPASAAVDALLARRTRQTLKTGRESLFELHTPGAVGCYLSHVAIWRYVVEQRLAAALVFEDDVTCPSSSGSGGRAVADTATAQTLARYVREAGGVGAFDLLWLSSMTTMGHGGREQVADFSPHLVRTRGPRWCSQAYVVTRRGAERLLRAALPISINLDTYMFETAAERPDFVLLRPKRPLFRHSVTNVLTSSIGYNAASDLGIVVPAQWRTHVTGAIVLLVVALLVATIVATTLWRRQARRAASRSDTAVPPRSRAPPSPLTTTAAAAVTKSRRVV